MVQRFYRCYNLQLSSILHFWNDSPDSSFFAAFVESLFMLVYKLPSAVMVPTKSKGPTGLRSQSPRHCCLQPAPTTETHTCFYPSQNTEQLSWPASHGAGSVFGRGSVFRPAAWRSTLYCDRHRGVLDLLLQLFRTQQEHNVVADGKPRLTFFKASSAPSFRFRLRCRHKHK